MDPTKHPVVTPTYADDTHLAELRALTMSLGRMFVLHDTRTPHCFRIETPNEMQGALSHHEARGWINGYIAGRANA